MTASFDLDTIRAAIPALARCVYLNTGTFGPLPTAVANEIRRVYDRIEQQGTFAPPVFYELEVAGFEAVRRQVAALLHADPAEIALTRNVTDGINIVLHGLDWRPGDQVILTDHEHPSGTVPWLALAERAGVELRWLELTNDPDAIVERFEALLGPRVRLAQLSHVSCLTGLRLPVERLCRLAQEAGVLTLVDGAHAEGQFAVDVSALGCDFYAACGHKWLLGPQGVGMLYVRREHVERLRPAWLGWDVHQTFDRAARAYTLPPTAARFEQSTRAWPLYLAFGKAIEFVQGVGWEAIEARVRDLRRRFVAGLSAVGEVELLSPTESSLGTGLVTVRVAGWPCEALQARLWERHRIVTNVIREFNALRFSLAFFTSEEDLAAALQALAEAVRP
ncbi:MAG: aminotransferase class V-fold PLP-dependent enzyme [Caldilineales bacterium]|nr:aminotransferase class V-fold PLP-dependent enzyme [Caldilineales bacterium]MDW8318543.1 aminotransferase class V-fold PLP-dependent enzyme [Anaerolineae bacterium]